MRKYRCPDCGKKGSYKEKYDAYFCSKCNKWLDTKCSDITCEYCSKRPDNPIGS